MTPIVLHVPMKPKAWERTRDYKGRRITDEKVKAAKTQLALVAKSQMPCAALDGSLSVAMVFYYHGKTKDSGPQCGSLSDEHDDCAEAAMHERDNMVRNLDGMKKEYAALVMEREEYEQVIEEPCSGCGHSGP